MWGFYVRNGFHREERCGGCHCREAAEGFGAAADGVGIVQDRFGPEVVGERLSRVWGGCFEWERGRGHVHCVPKDILEVCRKGDYGMSAAQHGFRGISRVGGAGRALLISKDCVGSCDCHRGGGV